MPQPESKSLGHSTREELDPYEFVREQIASHVGHGMENLDDKTIISGSVVASVMEALDEVLDPKTPANTDLINPSASYTVYQCVTVVRARINGQRG